MIVKSSGQFLIFTKFNVQDEMLSNDTVCWDSISLNSLVSVYYFCQFINMPCKLTKNLHGYFTVLHAANKHCRYARRGSRVCQVFTEKNSGTHVEHIPNNYAFMLH